ncbi:MAG: TolC family protein [Planctomycetaceae bacterium]|nr:TolC family protein [Planctomycetaceae bacterium]
MSEKNYIALTRKLLFFRASLKHRLRPFTVLTSGLLALGGCASTSSTIWEKTVGNETCEVDSIMSQVDSPAPPVYPDLKDTRAPLSVEELRALSTNFTELSLADALYDGLSRTTVLRDIGGTILRSPDQMKTSFSRQMQHMDPRFGTEAALSAFDAQFSASANFNQNDRVYNNSFFAGGIEAFNQDYNDYQMELSKRTATGSFLALRGVSNFDGNNAPANTFRSAWNSWVEGEMRQPLLQGGGLEFNRIAGPGSTPGVYNGLLISKVNNDINDAEFQVALRDYISNVENAYWDLYLAFREYEARRKALEVMEELYQGAKARSAMEEVYVKQQKMQLQVEVDEALFGKILTGTQVRNGATGGTLQTGGGVLAAERRLRLLIGKEINDGSILRPTAEPPMTRIPFDWSSAVNEAITQRPELQKQNIAVKKREMELLAAKNFLNPRLDAVGKYRFRGFGDDLIGSGSQTGSTAASSLGNLATGEQQEWAVGVELTVPLGYRKAHAAVSHAELSLARERTVQKEQQREILANLSGAFTDVDRSWLAVQNSLEQYLAAHEYVAALKATEDGANGGTSRQGEMDRKIDGYRKLVQAEVQFFRARAEYAVALKNMHYEKGSLLAYKDLKIAERYEDSSAADSSEQKQPSFALPDSVHDGDAPAPYLPVGTAPSSGDTSPGAVPAIPDGSEQVIPASAVSEVAELPSLSLDGNTDAQEQDAQPESKGKRLHAISEKAASLVPSIPRVDFSAAISRVKNASVLRDSERAEDKNRSNAELSLPEVESVGSKALPSDDELPVLKVERPAADAAEMTDDSVKSSGLDLPRFPISRVASPPAAGDSSGFARLDDSSDEDSAE